MNTQQWNIYFPSGSMALYEYTAVEYIFSFWQYGTEDSCNAIPEAGASDQEIFDHLMDVSPVYYCSDQGFLYLQPLFYQAYTEFGYCPYVYDHLEGLLQVVTEPTYRSFAPQDVTTTFRPQVMQDVIPWLQNQGERIVYIYGGIDPWSAAALEPNGSLDSLMIMQPEANHSVKIQNLDQKDLVIQILSRWLDISINPSNIKPEATLMDRNRL